MAKATSSGSGAQSHPFEGKKAPAFELADAAGRKTALKDLLKGGHLVLYFYPKDLTPGCTQEACAFRDSNKALRALGAQVVGISGDSEDLHAKFAAKYELNFPLLSDPGNKVCKLYGVYQKKKLYGREFMGIVRTTFLIDRAGVVRKVFPKVRVEGHAQQVAAALESLA